MRRPQAEMYEKAEKRYIYNAAETARKKSAAIDGITQQAIPSAAHAF